MSILRFKLVKIFFRGKLKFFPLRGNLYVHPTFSFLFHHFPFLDPIIFFTTSSFNFQTSFLQVIKRSTMAFGHIIKHAPSFPSAADIPGPIFKDNHTYVPEPPKEDEKRKIWYS